MIAWAGRFRSGRILALFAVLCMMSSPVAARPRESSTPIGGITFNPARPATIRLKSRQVFRAKLIGISSELVHVRLDNGREFQYDLSEVERIQTHDREFRFVAASDTYRELIERAGELAGVSIEDSLPTVDGRPVAILPRPDPPPLPRMVVAPQIYRLNGDSGQSEEVTAARVVPAPPPAPAAAPPASTGPAAPFFETDTFKIGFLVACLVVIVLWWRNRVG